MSKIKITHEILDTTPRLRELANDGSIKGVGIEADGDTTIYTVSDSKLPLALAKEIQSLGAEVSELPLFIEIDKKDDPNLLGITHYDEEVDDEVVPTWEEAKRTNNYFIERDGKIFISTKAFTGKHLPLGDLDAVSDQLVHIDDLPEAIEVIEE